MTAVDSQAASPGPDGETVPEAVPLPSVEENGKLKPIELAIDELRGHVAVEQGDYKAGLPLLQKAGGVNPVYLARVEFLAGDREGALKKARTAVDQHKHQVQPLGELIDLLRQAGESKEAADRFAQLREMSADLDVDLPVFSRLAPLAAELNLPSDWRIAKVAAADVGERPPLDTLGPLHWQPYRAPEWNVSDGKGERISLSQYRGRPVVVIFYLGHQCLHCAQQLQAFAPLARDFAEAGISLVALSTDDEAGLAKSIENYKSEPFPFPLGSDPTLEAFKAYRVYDDFESRPLHGTFVLDASGFVRWQDIGFEPFRDARFVLKEARRQLSLAAPKPTAIQSAGP